MQPLIPYFEPFRIPLFGDVAIHGFGILVATAFIVGIRAAMNKCERENLDPDIINRLTTWLVVGVFVGGHLGDVLFYRPAEYLQDPIEILKVWKGMSSFGGFIGCTLLTIWFFRREKVPFFPYGDTLCYGASIAWVFGRLGCFSAHDHPGIETDFYLGVYGICPGYEGSDITACHDMGLYEAIWAGCTYLVFRVLDRKRHFPGYFIGMLLVLYGPTRFALDAFRHPLTDTRYAGMTPAQLGGVCFFALGAWILWSRRKLPVYEGDHFPESDGKPQASAG